MTETIETAFENCLACLHGQDTRRVDYLSRYPEYAQELTALLEIADRIKILQTVSPRTSFTEGAASRLVSRLPDRSGLFRPRRKRKRVSPAQLFRSSLRAAAIMAAGLVLLGLALGATALTANAAEPGDLLYGLDRLVEQVQIDLAPNPQAAAIIHLDNAAERLVEAQSRLAAGDEGNVQASLEAYCSEIESLAQLVASAEGVDIGTLEVLLTAARSQHLVVLAGILKDAPEPAHAGLQRVVVASNKLFHDLEHLLDVGVLPEDPPVDPGPPCEEPPCGPPEDVGPPEEPPVDPGPPEDLPAEPPVEPGPPGNLPPGNAQAGDLRLYPPSKLPRRP